MEYRYYRELKHNYLIVKEEDDAKEKMASYQARILEKGKLKGFIPCNMRAINNENYLYYEINSMQSLKDRFAVRGMNAVQLTKLFGALKESLESLSEYLLGMENVVLDTKSVFTDLSTGDYKFMYCPFKQEQADFAAFVEELVELVDHDDEAAVEMIYSCSEMAQVESVLALDCIDQLLQKDGYEEPEGSRNVRTSDTQEFIEFDESSFDSDEEEVEEEAEVDIRRKGAKKLGGKVQLLFGTLFIGLLVAMMYIRMNYILTKEENVLSIIVIVLSVVTGLVAIITGTRDLRSSFSGKNLFKKADETSEDEDGLDYCGEDFVEDYNEMQETSMDVESYKNPVNVTSFDKKTRYSRPNLQTCGETIVLSDEEDIEKDIVLYSRNTDKTIRIPLSKLPLTVGKMAGCVDKVLDDKSISRIHCRFAKDADDGLFVVDLGSTNGTYRNGLRLVPQEKNYLEEGDEIRIGRICFDCR